MLERIKDALQAKQTLDGMREQLKEQSGQVQKCTETVTKLSLEWAKAKEEQEALGSTTRRAIESWTAEAEKLAIVRKSLEAELAKFAVLKHDINTQIVNRFDKELAEQFRNRAEELRLSTDNYKQLKSDVEKAAGMLTSLNENIAKLQAVASRINAKDFEMTHFAKQLLALDKEKLELMRKIDTMERLVGAMRRRTG